MVSTAFNDDLAGRLAALGDDLRRPPSAEQVRDMLESLLTTLDGDLTTMDSKMVTEIHELSRFITEAKADLATIRPEEIQNFHIPTATDELDAVVSATEFATTAIMEAAEDIESTAEALDGEHATVLANAATRIYEACSFQDITGQRIGKVVGTLHKIEEKVDALLVALGDDDEAREKMRRRMNDQRSPAAAPTDADLMQGPQLPEGASSQDDIDALFASLD
jgi:chemotaxis protein CheZ